MPTNLPEPIKHAKTLTDIVSAIIADFTPGGATINQLYQMYLKKNMDIGKSVLIKEIERQGLAALSDDKLSFFVPASLRYFERVRLAEQQHNLRILAKIMVENLSDNDEKIMELSGFSKAVNCLSDLTEFDLKVFLTAYEISTNESDNSINAYDVTKEMYGSDNSNSLHVETTLTLLSAKALLLTISDGQNILSHVEEVLDEKK